MNKVIAYCKESYSELANKVSWPTWKELQNSAVVVMIASLLIALVIAGMDMGMKFVVTGGKLFNGEIPGLYDILAR